MLCKGPGECVVLLQDQRIPADMVLLRTTEKNGSCFIRTDQLDGETDWKLRVAVPSTQALPSDQVYTLLHRKTLSSPKVGDLYTLLLLAMIQ